MPVTQDQVNRHTHLDYTMQTPEVRPEQAYTETTTAKNVYSNQSDVSMPPPQNYAIQQYPSRSEQSMTNRYNYGANENYDIPTVGMSGPSYEPDGRAMHDFLHAIMGGNGIDMQLSSSHAVPATGMWTPRNVFDFGQDTDLELDDLDLNYLNGYNHQNPFAAYLESPETIAHSNKSSVPGDPPTALGIESLLRTSTWRFRPQTQDSSSSEQHNLSLPATETNKKLQVGRRMTAEPLSYNMRDRILAIIVSSCKKGNIPRSVLCFPSLELLDSLLQFYLASKFAMLSGLFHLPTLRPSRMRPELVAAMVAAGACLTPDSALQKLGLALQEALRTTLALIFEEDNTMISDVQCLQALVICLGIGLWSGNSRKMEIAESFLHPFITMIRRRGRFLRSFYDVVIPNSDDQGEQLEAKWEAWIEQERRKRLVVFYFLHSARQSITLSANPLISYAELALPLPAAAILWQAATAKQWKSAFLAMGNYSERVPSLIDLLRDVSLLGNPHVSFDTGLASQILLCGAWGLIWEYTQLSSINTGHVTQWSSSNLLLDSRLNELTKLLDCIGLSAPRMPMVSMILELLRMHLYVSLEEVHLFTGAQGHEEARRVYPLLQNWAKTGAARKAVAHASQIVAIARQIGQGCLRDFFAIALYQAGLTLWSFGVISNAASMASNHSEMSMGNSRSSLGPPQHCDVIAVLDGPETAAVQRFVNLNLAQGAISGSLNNQMPGSYVLLSDTGAIMGVLIDIFNMNHKVQQAVPPLVSNLTSLMDGLRTAVTD